MKRFICLLLISTFAFTARTEVPDRLDEALTTLRGRVIFINRTVNVKMMEFGIGAAFIGVPLLAAVGLGHFLPSGYILPRTKLDAALIGVPLTMAGGGSALAAFGNHRRQREPKIIRVPQPVAHYETVDGLNDFMGLEPEQQRRLAVDNPEFAAFLIRLGDAYAMVADHRLTEFP